ncbi:MAG: alpha/beta fold hydrolase [Candidatus Dormibacteria bacterium]
MSVQVRRGKFTSRGQRLSYTIVGDGHQHLVLMPGLLLPARMNRPLAEHLAERGHRVILLDPLGQGESARPADMWRYSMSFFARDVVALLDHLRIDQAVVGGTSLGANITLEVASLAPERLRGMLLEMPVLDNALVACAVAFSPLLVATTLGQRPLRWASRALSWIPAERLPLLAGALLDAVRQDPAPSGALLQGLFFGRTAPHRDERRRFAAPTLIIGHHRDPVHPFSDAGMLASELPNATLIDANSILAMRVRPERVWTQIDDWLDAVWERPVRVLRARRRAPVGAGPAAVRRAASRS